jgi:hypothetical protein
MAADVRELGNLDQGKLATRAALIGPCVLVCALLAGVTLRPDLGLRAAELELDAARARVAALEDASARLARLEAEGGLARAERLLGLARALVPAPLSELELHGLLRLSAERVGIELTYLELREPYDAGFEALSDLVLVREVHLEATGPSTEPVHLLAALRASGRPLAALELELERTSDDQYRWSLVLGLFEAHPLPAPDASTLADGDP